MSDKSIREAVSILTAAAVVIVLIHGCFEQLKLEETNAQVIRLHKINTP